MIPLIAAVLLMGQASQPASEPVNPIVPMLHCEPDRILCWYRQTLFLYRGWEARGEIIDFNDRRLELAGKKIVALEKAYGDNQAEHERDNGELYPPSSRSWTVPLVIGIVAGLAAGIGVTAAIAIHVRH